MPKVLVMDSTYENVDQALDRIFEEFPIDVEGKSVLVKPNILGPYEIERHLNTAPEVVRALVKRLKSSGGNVTVADNPGARGYGAVEKSTRVSGIMEASMGTFENISTDIETVELPGSGVSVNISKKVREADLLISVPKFKTHVFTVISGAIKNSFGFIIGGEKTRLHRDVPGYRVFSQMLVDVYRLRIPDLVIMDAVVGMQGNGPSGKSLYPVGKILASDDGVSLDSVMTHMMGAKPSRIAMLEYAHSEGLGEVDLSRIDILGDAGELKGFRVPLRNVAQLLPGIVFEKFYPQFDSPRFLVDFEQCSTCGQCRDVCPAGAITLEDKHPVYDYTKCIACYCCMELCSEQAIEVKDGLLTRVLKKLGTI